jgi:hypothetical protein
LVALAYSVPLTTLLIVCTICSLRTAATASV